MTKLVWDKVGERLYETGVDHGVLYIPNASGQYLSGVAWNGLTAITESPSGAEATPLYADNIKYLNLRSAEEFGATIEAYTYPPEFDQFDGVASPVAGVAVGQQSRKTFGLGYRTRVGNDTNGSDHGYKLHLIYGATAAPSEKAYATINDSPEAITFSWELTTTPVEVSENLKPTAQLTIDSTKVDATALAALEAVLYGSAGVEPRLPLPGEVLAFFTSTVTEVEAVAPTFNASTDIITIPAVTGLVYSVDGVDVAAGAFGPILDDVLVKAVPSRGYKLAPNSDDDWAFSPN